MHIISRQRYHYALTANVTWTVSLTMKRAVVTMKEPDIQTQYATRKFERLSDGATAVAGPDSKTGGATLEIKVSNSKVYKI